MREQYEQKSVFGRIKCAKIPYNEIIPIPVVRLYGLSLHQGPNCFLYKFCKHRLKCVTIGNKMFPSDFLPS